MTTQLSNVIEQAEKLVKLLKTIQTKQTSEKAASASTEDADAAVIVPEHQVGSASLPTSDAVHPASDASLAPPASADPAVASLNNASADTALHDPLAPPASAAPAVASLTASADTALAPPAPDASAVLTTSHEAHAHETSDNVKLHPLKVTEEHNASATEVKQVGVTSSHHASADTATTNVTPGPEHASSSNNVHPATAKHIGGGTIKRKRRMTKGKGRKTMKH
jgi:hypothetical protein